MSAIENPVGIEENSSEKRRRFLAFMLAAVFAAAGIFLIVAGPGTVVAALWEVFAFAGAVTATHYASK